MTEALVRQKLLPINRTPTAITALSASTPNSIGTGLGRFTRSLLHVLYNAYILAVLGGLAFSFFAIDSHIRDLWIARTIAIAVGLLLSILLVLFVWCALNFSRKARYAEVLPNLHEIHHALRDLQTQISDFQREGIHEPTTRETYRKVVVEGFQRVLTQVVVAYSVTSGVNCRASIKLVGLVNDGEADKLENLYVRTLARDVVSAHACVEKDRHDDKKEHLVTANTDFERLVKGVDRYFFSPNINKREGYQNSSLEYWTKNRPLAALAANKLPWLVGRTTQTSLYPYTSAMTFPVKGKPVDGAERGIMGFLCVDTMATDGFRERYDANLGASIADSLYHPLREYGLLMVSSRKK